MRSRARSDAPSQRISLGITVLAAGLVLSHCGSSPSGDRSRGPADQKHPSAPPPRPYMADPVDDWLAAPPLSGLPGRDYFMIYFDRDPRPFRAIDYAGRGRVYDGHHGSDFGISSMDHMDEGVPILAVADGVVREVQDGHFDRQISRGKGRLDNIVLIDHRGERMTRYHHLRKGSIRVKPGDKVRAGQQIARMGSAGDSAFPHLHLDVIEQGKYVDPFGLGRQSRWHRQPPYLPASRVTDAGLTRWHLRRPWPFVPGRLTTIPAGHGLIAWAFLMQDRSGRPREWRLLSPDGKPRLKQSFTLPKHVHVRTAYWNLSGFHFSPGDWQLELWERDLRDSREKRLLSMKVCAGVCPPIVPTIHAARMIRHKRFVVCEIEAQTQGERVQALERVRYEYRWTTDGVESRREISAQHNDYLPFETGIENVACSVRPLGKAGAGEWVAAR